MTVSQKIFVTAIVCFAFVPAISFAAFDDVTLTTDVTITVGGVDLNISGSSAVVESITVNPSNFSFVLQSGSSITVTSPDRRELSTDASSEYVTSNICNGSESTLAHASSAGSATVTVTPGASFCAGSSGGSGSGPSSSSSDSTDSSDSDDEDTEDGTEEDGTEEEGSEEEREELFELITVLQKQITLLQGRDTTTACPRFTTNYQQGDSGGEVSDIQMFLRNEGLFTYPENTGYFGPITDASVRAFQEVYGDEILTPLGLLSSTGNWFSSTRAKANALAGCS